MITSATIGGGAVGGGSMIGTIGAAAIRKKKLVSQLTMENRNLQDNLAIAAASQNITQRRRLRSVGEDKGTMSVDIPPTEVEKLPPPTHMAGEAMMKSSELQLMTPLLHFLQLLCENHNNKLQVSLGGGGGRGGEGEWWESVW